MQKKEVNPRKKNVRFAGKFNEISCDAGFNAILANYFHTSHSRQSILGYFAQIDDNAS